jgi:molybdopterin molybdotransferase
MEKSRNSYQWQYRLKQNKSPDFLFYYFCKKIILIILRMVELEAALNLVLSSAKVAGTENTNFQQAFGRVLAEDVFSDTDMPPFDKSAVDGYACRREDLADNLEVIEIIPAGRKPEKKITPCTCSKIMTGGMVPEGADTVLMVEDVIEAGINRIRLGKDKTAANICYQGEDVKQGQLVLSKGTLIRPQEIAVLASVGCINPKVYIRPRIGVISTGDELVEPSENPQLSQIRNSNASQLIAQVQRAGAIHEYFGIAPDTEDSTRKLVSSALEKCDVVLLTGGVSMGDYDFVPGVLKELDINLLFESIAVQPGRPTIFGTGNGKYLFGLPGNPVSSFVQFEMLVKPLIYALMGHTFKPGVFKLPMGASYQRRNTKRKSLLPVVIRENKAYPVEYHGSAHIHSYIFAEGIVAVEIGKTGLETGEWVDVRQI